MLRHNSAHPNLSPSHIILPPSPQILLAVPPEIRVTPTISLRSLLDWPNANSGLHNASRIHDSAEERHFPVHDLHIYRQEYSCAGELTALLFFVLSPLAGLPCSSVLATRAPRVAASALRSTELPFADLGFDFLASQVTQLESRISSQWVCDMFSICDRTSP